MLKKLIYLSGLMILVQVFIYIHTVCMLATKALVSLHIWAGLPESLLFDHVIITEISKTKTFIFLNQRICFGCSKEPSWWDGSFEHPKCMFMLMVKEIITVHSQMIFFPGP